MKQYKTYLGIIKKDFMKPWKHSLISARKFGGKPEDYIELHDFFDSTKAFIPSLNHRAVLHNSWGIFLLERIYGTIITNSDGKQVSVRDVGEQHVIDDLGTIPTLEKCMEGLPFKRWIGGPTALTKGDPEDILTGPIVLKAD